MAWRQEKDGDIVIDGFEKGIASSPHFGLANIQNANISTELGEVNCSFVRENQIVQGAISGGTLTFDSSGGNTTKLDAPADLYGGQWITVTAATATIYDTSADVSYLAVGGGGAGGGTQGSGEAGGGGGAGEVATGTHTVVAGDTIAITIGAGGTGGTGTGANGSDTVLGTVKTAVGGGGGGRGDNSNGASGGSGGGAGSNNSGGGTGGAATAGFAGGNGQNNTGGNAGGGGGASVAGEAGNHTAHHGGSGGNGVASSITGSSVTYGGGGGGGSTDAGGGSGGTGGGGNAGGAAGSPGTANTGGGGGGCARGATPGNGGDGGSGIAVVRYLATDMTATGGTITTDGLYKVHTFTTDGTFTVTSIIKEITLPTGNYYVSYKDSIPQVEISSYYDPFADHPISFVTSGTITFDTVATFGNPISKATERYGDSTKDQYRYYVLDDAGYVWVYDTAVYDDSLASSGIGITWILPDPSSYSGFHWNSIAILDGTLLILNTQTMKGKSTMNLGAAFVQLDNVYFTNAIRTHTNYAFTGHQGRLYYCDGNYIGSLFPDTSLLTGAANVQSFCSYSAGAATVGSINAIISGSLPLTLDSSGNAIRIPAVFFTDQYGTQPTNLSVDTVYYISPTESQPTTIEVYAALTGGSAIDIQAGASGNQYFNTFWPYGGDSGAYGTSSTVVFTAQRLNLPSFEVAKTIAEIGNQVLIGCVGNVVYPWNQVDTIPSGLINLPESNVQYILTVNQTAYMFAGNQGNIYITDGSLASLALNLSDYLAGVQGSPGTYIESTYTWSDSMYLRGRVYFSVLDQSSTKTGNCGGIWSFVPTQNLYLGQDTGIGLRLEAQNSYNTYNGAAALLIPNAVQNAQQPLYWSAWYSSVSAPTYGIDYSTGGTNASFPAVVETDWIPIGTMLNKKTTSQLEYKLGAPLDTGATITAKYRTQLTDSWTPCDTFVTDSSKLGGYARANYQQLQWIQFQFTLTPITSSATTNTFIRFRQIRLR